MTTYLNEEKKQALAQFKDCNVEDITECYTNNYFEVDGKEYEVLTDGEADSRFDEEIESYIDECVLPEIPERYHNYFDYEAFKRDCSFDGRGHTISKYDGEEYEEKVGEEYFYIYRQN